MLWSICSAQDTKKVKMIAFGVGVKIDNGELREIAGDNIFHGADFKHLYQVVKELVGTTCQVAEKRNLKQWMVMSSYER